MNIFVLDADPRQAAQYLCDKHVIKMTLEYAQILSVYNQHKCGVYRPTHSKHPCVLWAGRSLANYQWLWEHAKATAFEYTYRYGKRHKSEDVIDLCELQPGGVLLGALTPFVLAMPEYCRGYDPVRAYRVYYINEKLRFANWTARQTPEWVKDLLK